MKIKRIITACLGLLLSLSALAQPVEAKDGVLLDMANAFKKNDRKTLVRLLPHAKGHALEPWAAYWELRIRLGDAGSNAVSQSEVDAFFKRYAQTYAEDRLRADWLLVLGQRRDWEGFGANYAAYRMRDDKDILCYAAYAEFLRSSKEASTEVEKLWMTQKETTSGCGYVADALIEAGKMSPLAAWRKAFREKDKPQAAWSLAQRHWALGVQGRSLAQKLDLDALQVFAQVSEPADLSDDMLAWWARAALRVQDWPQVARVIGAMSEAARQDATWVYWLAIAKNDRKALESMAFGKSLSAGFYEQLAAEVLNIKINLGTMPQPAPLSEQERAAARANQGLQRALLAIRIGLRSEGVREWNYEVNLAKGSMGDRERLAAAEWACSQEVWDRCISTSERTRREADWTQRFPMPYQKAVVQQAQATGVDPAYVYGLIRQESRFVTDARSSVGASGLMQIMPTTAKWTAKKIGLTSYTRAHLSELDTNLVLGMSYLKILLGDFESSTAPALAAAAYNAGPSRARAWRSAMLGGEEGKASSLDTAVWIENIPFPETRDYVKKVLANTNIYAARLTGQTQSLRARLGRMMPAGREAEIPATP